MTSASGGLLIVNILGSVLETLEFGLGCPQLTRLKCILKMRTYIDVSF